MPKIIPIILTLCFIYVAPEAFSEPGARMLIAQKQKGKKQRKARQRFLRGEARTKGGKTEIDFDEASIDGRRRTPTGVAISKDRPDHEYDLIKLRLRWHPEMKQSTTNLETGRGR